MSRAATASSILKRYALTSGGAGLITAPFLGMAALTALHLALIRELSHLYGVEFSKESARGIVLALGVAFVPGWLGFGLQNTILKRLPVLTGAVGWVAMAGMSAVVTYGLGKTLIEHFEAGGTLADFDVKHLHQAVRHLFGSAAPSTP
ncbi:MAG: DUF697 domain-containing protein [Acidobacteriota bacterium]|nr:DUF697 domain-containing protein [Acidobacteriota bacterium]